MADPWTTRAEPGMRDRRACPLCDWFLDPDKPGRLSDLRFSRKRRVT